MRAAFLARELSGDNGWGRLSLETVRGVARLGVSSLVLSSTAASLDEENVDVRIVLPPWPSGHLAWAVGVGGSLPRVVREIEGSALVHCLTEPYLPLAAMASWWRGLPFVVSAVGTYATRRMKGSGWSPFAFWARRADRIVCISRYTESQLLSRWPGARTSVVNPGVDSTRFTPGTPTGPAAEARGRVVLGVGAVKPRKGYDLAIRALAKLPPSLGDVSLYIAGSFETHAAYAEGLKTLSRELGVGSRVHLLGRVGEEDLIGWYRRADVFLLNASNVGEHYEGFGLVLLEAGACGTPVVGCRDCGNEDIVTPGDNGLLVPQNDPEATAEALSRILETPDLRRRMGERGRARAGVMSWEASAVSMVHIYEEVLDARGGVRVPWLGESP